VAPNLALILVLYLRSLWLVIPSAESEKQPNSLCLTGGETTPRAPGAQYLQHSSPDVAEIQNKEDVIIDSLVLSAMKRHSMALNLLEWP
jgi:hypothetical protein